MRPNFKGVILGLIAPLFLLSNAICSSLDLSNKKNVALNATVAGLGLRKALDESLTSLAVSKASNIYIENAGSDISIIQSSLLEQERPQSDNEAELNRLLSLIKGRSFYLSDYKLNGPKLLGAPIRKIIGKASYDAESQKEVIDSIVVFASLGNKEDNKNDEFLNNLHEALIKAYGPETSSEEREWRWGFINEPSLTIKYNGELIYELSDKPPIEYKNKIRTRILEIESLGKPQGPIKISPTLQ